MRGGGERGAGGFAKGGDGAEVEAGGKSSLGPNGGEEVGKKGGPSIVVHSPKGEGKAVRAR